MPRIQTAGKEARRDKHQKVMGPEKALETKKRANAIKRKKETHKPSQNSVQGKHARLEAPKNGRKTKKRGSRFGRSQRTWGKKTAKHRGNP